MFTFESVPSNVIESITLHLLPTVHIRMLRDDSYVSTAGAFLHAVHFMTCLHHSRTAATQEKKPAAATANRIALHGITRGVMKPERVEQEPNYNDYMNMMLMLMVAVVVLIWHSSCAANSVRFILFGFGNIDAHVRILCLLCNTLSSLRSYACHMYYSSVHALSDWVPAFVHSSEKRATNHRANVCFAGLTAAALVAATDGG